MSKTKFYSFILWAAMIAGQSFAVNPVVNEAEGYETKYISVDAKDGNVKQTVQMIPIPEPTLFLILDFGFALKPGEFWVSAGLFGLEKS